MQSVWSGKDKNYTIKANEKKLFSGENENTLAFKSSVASPGRWSDKWKETLCTDSHKPGKPVMSRGSRE